MSIEVTIPTRAGWHLAYKIRGGREVADVRCYATEGEAQQRIKEMRMEDTMHAVYVSEKP